MMSRKSWSWRATARCIAAGYCSQRLVLPSISVKRKVMVPVGYDGNPGLLCVVASQHFAAGLGAKLQFTLPGYSIVGAVCGAILSLRGAVEDGESISLTPCFVK